MNLSDSVFCSDFDGTIIDGDIVTGFKSDKGIPEYLYSIGKIKSDKYPDYPSFISDFHFRKQRNDTTVFEIPYTIYDQSQDPYIEEYWDQVISKHFVPYTLDLIQKKIEEGNKIWIISSSPTVYIQPLLKYLDVEKIIGIQPNQLIVYGQGKKEALQRLTSIKKISGYIGDNWINDGVPMASIRNYNPNADLRLINWGNLNPDISQNLKLYQVQQIDL